MGYPWLKTAYGYGLRATVNIPTVRSSMLNRIPMPGNTVVKLLVVILILSVYRGSYGWLHARVAVWRRRRALRRHVGATGAHVRMVPQSDQNATARSSGPTLSSRLRHTAPQVALPGLPVDRTSVAHPAAPFRDPTHLQACRY